MFAPTETVPKDASQNLVLVPHMVSTTKYGQWVAEVKSIRSTGTS